MKLIRDRVPERALEAGDRMVVMEVNAPTGRHLLRRKLREELEEYLESGDPVELADLLEVMYALEDRNELERLRAAKEETHGAFQRRLARLGNQP